MALSLAAIVALSLILKHALATDKDVIGDCRRFQEAIDRYVADRKIAPQSARELVDGGYIANIGSDDQCRIFWRQNSN
jgi:hypothetical protein